MSSLLGISSTYVGGLGDVCKLVADNSKAKNLLSWSPNKSLEEMCRNGWKWKCLNPAGYTD